MTENERFELVFAKTGSINSDTGRFFQRAEKPSEGITRAFIFDEYERVKAKCLIL